MNDEVFKAILALDSYNRGYHPGISGLDDTPDVTFLGNAKIVRASQDGDDIGFYAIAYEWNGETIISYRGTA